MRGKATIERTFLSINTLFCQHVAGYTGRDVTRRGSGPDSQELWSLADLQELLDEWVIGWQCRPHDGLRHPFTPDQPCSPNDAYAALVAAAGYVPVALTGEDYIELMPAEWRTIGDGGIQIDYRTYNCGELGPYRRMASGVAGKGTRWEVHFDPLSQSSDKGSLGYPFNRSRAAVAASLLPAMGGSHLAAPGWADDLGCLAARAVPWIAGGRSGRGSGPGHDRRRVPAAGRTPGRDWPIGGG